MTLLIQDVYCTKMSMTAQLAHDSVIEKLITSWDSLGTISINAFFENNCWGEILSKCTILCIKLTMTALLRLFEILLTARLLV